MPEVHASSGSPGLGSERPLRWRIAFGFGASASVALAVALSGYVAIGAVTQALDSVTAEEAHHLILAERVRHAAEQALATSRGYLLSGDQQMLSRLEREQDTFLSILHELRRVGVESEDTARLIVEAEELMATHQAAFARLRDLRSGGADADELSSLYDEQLRPARSELGHSLADVAARKEAKLAHARERALLDAAHAKAWVVALTGFGLAAMGGLALVLGRQLLRLYRQEREASAAARSATAARDELLAIVSHDLQNPLSAVLLNLARLERRAANAAASQLSRPIVQSIRSAVQRMQHLIRNLLDSASLEAGRLSIHPEPCPVAPLFADAVQLFEPLAAQKDLRLRWEAAEEGLAVAGDRERLFQVLANLVGNAIKFTPAGGEVVLRACRRGAEVRLEVRDTGPGIAEELRTAVFERYWRTAQKGYKGTGLGLYVTRGIVEGHGGRIWLDPAPGGGTLAVIQLPALERTDSPAEVPDGLLASPPLE